MFLWRNLQMLCKVLVTAFIFFTAAAFLSPSEFGSFNYIRAVMAFLIIFCDFGLSTSTARAVASYTVSSPEKIGKTPISVCAPIILLSGIFSSVILAFGSRLFGEYHRYVILFLPYLAFFPIVSVLDGYYRGLERFRRLALSYLAVSIPSVPLSFFLISRFGIAGAVLSLDVLYMALALILLLGPPRPDIRFDGAVLRRVFGYAVFIGLANISYFMYTRIDIIILKQFGYLTEIGYYSLIDRFFAVIVLPAIILGQVLAPGTSRAISSGERRPVLENFHKYIPRVLLASAFITFIIYLIFPRVISMVLPQYYTGPMITIFRILMFLLPLKLAGIVSVNGFMTPGGYIKIVTLWTFVGGVLNIALDYVFISMLGFSGVFLVTLAVHSVIIVLENVIFYSRIRRGPLPSSCHGG